MHGIDGPRAAKSFFNNLAALAGFFARFSARIAIPKKRGAVRRSSQSEGAQMNRHMISSQARILRHVIFSRNLCRRMILRPTDVNTSPDSQDFTSGGEVFLAHRQDRRDTTHSAAGICAKK